MTTYSGACAHRIILERGAPWVDPVEPTRGVAHPNDGYNGYTLVSDLQDVRSSLAAIKSRRDVTVSVSPSGEEEVHSIRLGNSPAASMSPFRAFGAATVLRRLLELAELALATKDVERANFQRETLARAAGVPWRLTIQRPRAGAVLYVRRVAVDANLEAVEGGGAAVPDPSWSVCLEARRPALGQDTAWRVETGAKGDAEAAGRTCVPFGSPLPSLTLDHILADPGQVLIPVVISVAVVRRDDSAQDKETEEISTSVVFLLHS